MQTNLKHIVISLLVMGSPLVAAETKTLPVPLVPYPQEVKMRDGSLTVKKKLILKHDGRHVDLVNTCAEDLKLLVFDVVEDKAKADATVVNLDLAKDPHRY